MVVLDGRTGQPLVIGQDGVPHPFDPVVCGVEMPPGLDPRELEAVHGFVRESMVLTQIYFSN